MEKTNVMRIIERKKLKYNYHFYNPETVNGAEVAAFLKEDPERVFKTLVTVGKSNKNYVFMVPVCQELDLKKAAKAVAEKSIEMIKAKDLFSLTGYIPVSYTHLDVYKRQARNICADRFLQSSQQCG